MIVKVRIIDTLPDVLNILRNEQNSFTFKFDLIGHPAQNRYPFVKIEINHGIMWQGTIQDIQQIVIDTIEIDVPHIEIKIHYLNKTDNDTVIADSEIIENQCVEITNIKINQIIDICKNDLINLSLTDYDLTQSQKEAYSSINASWCKISTNVLYDNGVWSMMLHRPIIDNLLKLQQREKRVLEISHHDILNKLQTYFDN